MSLPKVVYPKPSIHASLKSTVKGEEEKVASGLAALHHEDPTFLHHVDGELHQTILAGQGELHLDVLVDLSTHTRGARPGILARKPAVRNAIIVSLFLGGGAILYFVALRVLVMIPILGWSLLSFMPILSAAAGVLYALQYNKAGEVKPLFTGDSDDAGNDRPRLPGRRPR